MTRAELICRLRTAVKGETMTITITADQVPAMAELLLSALLPGDTATVTVTNKQAQRMADRLSAAARRARA